MRDQDARAIRQACRQERMFPADPLMGKGCNLARQPVQRCCGQLGNIMALNGSAQSFDPELARAIDIEIGHIVAGKERLQGRQIVAQIDAAIMDNACHLRCSTAVKSRSRATNTDMRAP